MRLLAEKGTIMCVAAGNYGPAPGSMSIFALSPYVVSVGATSMDGNLLCDYSSRGIPGVPHSGPTVVAPGLAACPVDAAPDYVRTPKQEARDIERLGRTIARRFTLQRGTSFSTPVVTGIMALIASERERLRLPIDYFTMRRVLCAMALPVPGREPWEVGSGFVNGYVARQYLKRLAMLNGVEYYPTYSDKMKWRRQMDARFHYRAIQKIFGMVLALLLLIGGFLLLYKGLGKGFDIFIEYKGGKAVIANCAPGSFLILCGSILAGIIVFRPEKITTEQLEMTQEGAKIKQHKEVSVQTMDDD